MKATISQSGGFQNGLVDFGAIIEAVEGLQVYRKIPRTMAGIVESPFRDSPDQRHLPAFEADSDGTSRTRGLAFATASAGFAVAGGLALPQSLAAMLGSRPRFKIM